ncbi:hypothetical protein ABZV93_18535 [Actinopolymorpha sp. NPDC004070]|uniref:hypothetical protein n=1 Tax=Actinopolymorpha sp. NPDC004070 TaxID=3154548 RepID=UPI0033B3D766
MQDHSRADGMLTRRSLTVVKANVRGALPHPLQRQPETADRRLEEMGYLGPDHPDGHRNQGAGARCRPADGHHPTTPGSDGDTNPDR